MEPPISWLPNFNPGIPNFPNGDIGFVTGKVVPFVISLLLFLVIIFSLIFLLIGGIMWTTGSGDKERTAKAKATVTYALVGLALGLGSFIILKVIFSLLGS